ncbi:alpha/beta fold hydrolase [Streptomyces indonesiensis]
MSDTTGTEVLRTAVQVDGESASYLTVERDGPAVLLLHGTYWSRVWLPVLARLADAGLRPLAVDLPGLGRSGGELTPETATVPALADWVARFASAVGIRGAVLVAGHDIGGAIAQHLLVHDRLEVSRLALVNSVTYDSWPAPHVARFRGPGGAAEDVLAARRQAVTAALAAPPPSSASRTTCPRGPTRGYAAPGRPWRARPTAATPSTWYPRCGDRRRPSC